MLSTCINTVQYQPGCMMEIKSNKGKHSGLRL